MDRFQIIRGEEPGPNEDLMRMEQDLLMEHVLEYNPGKVLSKDQLKWWTKYEDWRRLVD